MALEQKLHLKMSQKLMMTPQLQQAIKLLQYQKLELQEVLTQQVVENPVLEEVAENEGDNAPEAGQDAPKEEAKPADKEPEVELKDLDNNIENIDYESYFQDYYDNTSYQPRSTEVPELPTTENTLAKTVSLAEHLLWQLSEVSAKDRVHEAARAIVGNINADGYLVASLDELRAMSQNGHGYEEAEIEQALQLVQGLDPIGVGARDLTECLLLQLKHCQLGGSECEAIVRDHLELVRRHRFDEIAKKLGVGLDVVLASIDVIRHLDPKPGLKYSDEGNHYVVPDVFVVKVDGEYQVVLNEEGLPRLRISPVYRRLLQQKETISAETRKFVNEKLKAALWLIRSLEQRQKTIFRVAESIVKYQREFLDRGIEFLKPLVLRDVAEDIGMHESTVSRVVTNKYMHTPQGLFEMKYFFHSSIHSETGVDVSSRSVMQKIRKYIEEEDAARPLSDSKIVKLLKAEGLEIARRTVAKYREEMKIASSTFRRQVHR